MQSRDRHSNEDLEHLQHPPKFPRALLQPISSPLAPGTAALSSVTTVFPLLEFSLKGIRPCVIFRIWCFFTEHHVLRSCMFLHESGVCSFLLPVGIHCLEVQQFVDPVAWWWAFGLFPIFCFVLLWTFMCRFLSGHMPSFLFCKDLGVRGLGRVLGLCFNF